MSDNTGKIPEKVMNEIDSAVCTTERVNRLIKARKEAVEHICCERSHIVTKSWQETDGENLDIRRAKLFRSVMRENPILIRDDELIVGSQSKYLFGASPYVDYNPESAIENLKNFGGVSGGSSVSCAEISEEERKVLEEDAAYWSGRSTGDIIHAEERARFDWLGDWIESGFVLDKQTGAPPGVRSVDYGMVIREGLESVIARAKEQLANLDYDMHSSEAYRKDCFLRAAIIACEGAVEYAHRYSGMASNMAEKTDDPVRKAELQRIAEACAWVPEKPARSFFEAVQCFWLIHLCVNLETAFLAEHPSRLDQYLYPMYRKSVIEEGSMSRAQAAELMACLYVKFNELTCVKNSYDKKNIPGTHLQDVTICGVDRDGKDASNELSYMMLEVLAQVKFPQPPIYVRYHENIDRKIWMKALEVNVRRGDGNPALLSDKARIDSFVDHGIALEDARDWAAAGCAGSITPHVAIHGGSLGINYINLSKILEYVLFNGCEPKNGKQIGLRTGDPKDFKSIEDFKLAFEKQFDYLIKFIINMSHVVANIDASSYHIPFASALLGDCIEKGMDARSGGLRYSQFLYHVSDRGLQDVADSLAAIDKLVFDEGKLTMDQVITAVKANFEGYEDIRAMLKKAPKYGNDDDSVDGIFDELSVWLQDRIAQEHNPYGSSQWTGRSGAVAHVTFGKVTGALPDGRKAGESLADGFLSPAQGMDVNGPTAVFNSASKADHVYNSTGALMNMKFERKVFNDKENLEKLSALVENFFDRGGYHIQINILDRETLAEAQKNPAEYPNLMVRVAGYSAFFVDLPRNIQNEILARTSEGM